MRSSGDDRTVWSPRRLSAAAPAPLSHPRCEGRQARVAVSGSASGCTHKPTDYCTAAVQRRRPQPSLSAYSARATRMRLAYSLDGVAKSTLGSPSSNTPPPSPSMTTWLATDAKARRWLTRMTVRLLSDIQSASNCRTSANVNASTPARGSSRMTIGAWSTRIRASANRCFCPSDRSMAGLANSRSAESTSCARRTPTNAVRNSSSVDFPATRRGSLALRHRLRVPSATGSSFGARGRRGPRLRHSSQALRRRRLVV